MLISGTSLNHYLYLSLTDHYATVVFTEVEVWYCPVISVNTDGVWIGNQLETAYNYHTPNISVTTARIKSSSVYTSHCLMVASNSRLSPYSGFTNCCGYNCSCQPARTVTRAYWIRDSLRGPYSNFKLCG
jgi:hypothetical protein